MKQYTNQQLTQRFALLQAAFFAGYSGCAFLSYFLLQKNLSTAMIGVISATVSLSSSLAQPFWGILCDKYSCHRRFYILGSILCPAVYYTIANCRRIPVLFLCAFLSGAFINCMQNMSNGWVAELNHAGYDVKYSLSRGFGSLAYAFAAILYGRAILFFGNNIVPAIMAVFGILTISISMAIPRASAVSASKQMPHGKSESSVSLKEGLSILLHQRSYVIFVTCCFLALFSMSGMSTFYIVFLSELGANSQHIGLGNFVMAISEVPAMMLFSEISKKIPFRPLFFICVLAHGLQCILVAVSPNYVFAILAMVTQCLGFGLLIPCSQDFTYRCIDAKYTSTAQLFSSAVGLSASMVCGDLFASFLAAFLPLRTVFVILSLFAFAGSALFAVNAGGFPALTSDKV